MRIRSARITGFRNLDDVELVFSPGVNVLLGDNGQGKTNLLEALDYLSLGRSHRGARNEELVRLGGDHLHVTVEIERDDGSSLRGEFGLDRGGSRRIKLDGQPVTRRADLVGQLSTVFFSPDSVDLVRGGPELRRRFADQGLCGLDGDYLAALTAYQRSMRQKSRLLRDVRRGFRTEHEARRELTAWNEDLAGHATVIGRRRREWAGELAGPATEAYAHLAGRDTPLTIDHQSRLEALDEVDESAPIMQLERDILAEFAYIGPEEIRRGRPLTGPHLDDFGVRLGELDLRVYGSQGETRSAAVAMILAQSDVVYGRRRVRPVLFLDDIFSELDRDRARRLQERCAHDHQVFIATARPDDVDGWAPDEMAVWRVENGRLITLS
ncbi:DNA replication and repair protein RecF [bacterium]|nr:DNA replication and repair protein RecF [bacterium]